MLFFFQYQEERKQSKSQGGIPRTEIIYIYIQCVLGVTQLTQ